MSREGPLGLLNGGQSSSVLGSLDLTVGGREARRVSWRRWYQKGALKYRGGRKVLKAEISGRDCIWGRSKRLMCGVVGSELASKSSPGFSVCLCDPE